MPNRPPSLRRLRENYADYYDFVNLSNEWESFDLTQSIGVGRFPNEGVYYGREGTEWEDSALYRISMDRWVLLFILFPGDEADVPGQAVEAGPVGRELTPSEAARFLRLNEHRPPDGLRPAPSIYDKEALREGRTRLGRSWSPEPETDAKDVSVDASSASVGVEHTESGQDGSTMAISSLPSPEVSVAGDVLGSAISEIPVVLNGRRGNPVVYGNVKKRLTKARYDIINAFMSSPGNLSKQELDQRSGHTESRKILRSMANSDPDWALAIIFPEGPGTGYGIRR